MPNYITHALCANDVLQSFLEEKMLKRIQQYPQIFSMAASGPDFLFYYRVWPWLDQRHNDHVYNIGNTVHRHSVNAFYQKALDWISQYEESDDKEILIVYLAGHLMHWALDSVAHPYVFYHSGEIRGKTKYWHYRLESMLDIMMVKQVKGLNLKNIGAIDMLGSTQAQRKILSKMYAAVVKDVYGMDENPEVYEECFKTMPEVAAALFDPNGFKKPLIQTFERSQSALWKFSSHMIFPHSDEQHDILNLNHQEWLHPCDASMKSNKSFVDLYHEGTQRGLAALYAFSDVVDHQGSIDKLLSILKDRSYDTGLSEEKPMMFYQPFYEDLP